MTTNRKLICTLAILAGAALLSVPASAATTSGTVTVTATISSSVSMTFVTDAAGIALGGTGTSAATIAFGPVQAFGGVVPANVTKTVNGVVNWKLSTPFDVVVQVANQPASATYTLTAGLNAVDAVNTWQLGATTITGGAPVSLTALAAYGSTPYTLNLTFPFSEAAGAVSNVINFVATAN